MKIVDAATVRRPMKLYVVAVSAAVDAPLLWLLRCCSVVALLLLLLLREGSEIRERGIVGICVVSRLEGGRGRRGKA